ncbi:hypothetical protein ACFL2Y_03635 [Candidatus Omnitrophota bacterium]
METKRKGVSLRFIYDDTLNTFKKYSFIFCPFIIFASFELVSLAIIYFAPRNPLRAVLGPPIETFWGEKFLHFPTNFFLYPKLLFYSRMGLTIFVGSLLTGVAVSLVFGIYSKEKVKLSAAFMSALKKYISLILVVFVFTALFFILNKVTYTGLARYFSAGHDRLLFIKPELWLGPILAGINFVLAILVQSAFIYTIPIIIVETANPIKSIIRSVILFKRLFFKTIILVGLPMLFYIPKIILDFNNVFLMEKFFPEIVIIVSVLGIVVSTLFIDALITVSTAFLYLKNREE